LLYTQSKERDLLQKEVKAIKRLCGPGAHANIVQVLDHGQLSKSPYYFIDMEFCDLNLHDYIHRETSPEPSESTPYFIRGAVSSSSLQIWVVMSQIAAGAEYIHQKGHVHRDIKPANGTDSLFYD
jgi:serine/threonine protein kinase